MDSLIQMTICRETIRTRKVIFAFRVLSVYVFSGIIRNYFISSIPVMMTIIEDNKKWKKKASKRLELPSVQIDQENI